MKLENIDQIKMKHIFGYDSYDDSVIGTIDERKTNQVHNLASKSSNVINCDL